MLNLQFSLPLAAIFALYLNCLAEARQLPRFENVTLVKHGIEEDLPVIGISDYFIPCHYDIELKFPINLRDYFEDVEMGPFPGAKGKLSIFGKSNQTLNWIYFGGNHMEINDSSIKVFRTNSLEEEIPIVEVLQYPEGQRVLVLGNEIEAGEVIKVNMEYFVQIHSCAWSWIVPFCKGRYETDSGEIREFFLVYPNHWFQIFPQIINWQYRHGNLIDFRTTFEMTIIRPAEHTSLFNTELVNSTPDPEDVGWVRDTFSRTRKLQVDAIALFYGSNFTYAEATFGNKIARAYLPDFSAQRLDINNTATKVAHILECFDEFFDDATRIPKMDLVVVPLQKGWLTWGLNVYETITAFPNLDYPYYNEPKSRRGGSGFDEVVGKPLYPNPDGLDGYRETNRLTLIMARQWFASTWNQNSGMYFTGALERFLQYVGMYAVSEDTVGIESFILRDVQSSMSNAQKEDFHSLSERSSRGADDIDRGAPLLRMVDNVLTRVTMKKALQSYLLKVTEKGYATSQNLLESFDEAAAEDNRPLPASMLDIMHNWCEHGGLPIVKVDVVNTTHISFSQVEFSRYHDHRRKLWYIPVTFVSQDNPKSVTSFWMKINNKRIVVKHDASKWIFVNPDATGYYRTLYSSQLLQLLQTELERNPEAVSGMSRSQLLNDYLAFVERNIVDLQTTLNLTRFTEHEGHLAVFKNSQHLDKLVLKKFLSHEKYKDVQAYLQLRVGSALSEIGVDTQTQAPLSKKGSATVFWRELIHHACLIHSPQCGILVNKLFQEWMANPSFEGVDGFECAIVALQGEPAFDFVFQRYRELQSEYSKDADKLVGAMGCAKESHVVQKYLNKTLHPEEFLFNPDSDRYSQLVQTIIQNYLGANSFAQGEILPFLTTHWNEFESLFGKVQHWRLLVSVTTSLSQSFSTQDKLEEMEAFLTLIPDEMGKERFHKAQLVRRIETNIEWMDAAGNEIINMLSTESK